MVNDSSELPNMQVADSMISLIIIILVNNNE